MYGAETKTFTLNSLSCIVSDLRVCKVYDQLRQGGSHSNRTLGNPRATAGPEPSADTAL